jgi:hypothetical protein
MSIEYNDLFKPGTMPHAGAPHGEAARDEVVHDEQRRVEAANTMQAPSSRTTSLQDDGAAVEVDDFGHVRQGIAVDESTRLQLEAEPTRIDRSALLPDETLVVAVTEQRTDSSVS